MLELTVGYETNIEKNSTRKDEKCDIVIKDLSSSYTVKFINLSMGAIGVIGQSSKNLKPIFMDIGLSEMDFNFCMNRIINICIRTTYYLFCKRDKGWENPHLLPW